jgi:NAD-dependent deacetylase
MEPITDPSKAAAQLAKLLADAQHVTGFTGAGISTECGVPDFRSPGSPWMTNKPIPFAAFTASAEARKEAWRRKFTMDDTYAGAEPGRGHRMLAALHKSGQMPVLITQNIDGLHQLSGIPPESLVELHGSGGFAKCLTCEKRHELHEIRPIFEQSGESPACRSCGGLLKSATISFGQPMPEHEMRKAVKAALACDLFLAIGSSLVVYPAANLPQAAHQNGATLVIINGEPTAYDQFASLVIQSDIGTVLAETQSLLGL